MNEDNPSLSPYGPSPGRSSFFSSENRILLIVVFVISAAFAIVAIGTYWNYQKTLENNYEHFAEMITKVVSTQGAEMMASPFSPELKIKQFADNMIDSSDDIAAIEFYNVDNKLVYKTQKNLSEDDLRTAPKYDAPLENRTGNHGKVRVVLTRKTLKDIKSATSSIILWVFLGAWFTSILAVSFNTYILSKHLRTFVRGVKRLSTGDFGYKILEHDLWGELRTLAESFNDMSMRLRAYEDQNLETITFERNKLKGILLSIADGVVVCDTTGDITIINGAACEMLGYKNSEWAMGTNISDYVTTDNEKCFAPVITGFQTLCDEHGGRPPEFFSKTVELPERALKVIISPIEDSEGQTLGFVMIMHDVTREYEVDKLKTNFISNVSHELRTPVTTIKSYVDTIYNHGEELDRETYSEFIETINVETDRLKKLVNDILDFSRLEEGNFDLEKEEADITPVINLTVQSVKVLAEQKNIAITTAIESNLPRVWINSDSIERVLRNLLSNAIKYTPADGKIKVRAEVSEVGDALEISVQDNGIGIPEEHLPHIFERFYRVENEVHTIKGTGLGLHLVKIAIEKHHNGEVFVHSKVGAGSTFGFRLPLKNPVEPPKKARAGQAE